MKKRSVILIVASFVLLSAVKADTGHFDYLSNGADWGEHEENSKCKSGLEQSPIDLVDDKVTVSQTLWLKGSNY